jgi:predicted dehydrogenase/threonine dehydrogenase-like Zn-dependent dehydrogenase
LLIENGNIAVKELPDPTPDIYEAIVANAYSAVSIGTERSMLLSVRKGLLSKVFEMLRSEEMRNKALEILRRRGVVSAYRAWRQLSQSVGGGIPIGYSSAGYVVAVGKGVRDVDVGDRVACAGAGYASHAELVVVPSNLVIKVPENVDLADASFTTIGSIALHALRLSCLQPGESIAIIGTGLIGLIAVQIAKNVFNSKVIAIDIDNERITLAKKLGADDGLVATSVDYKSIANRVLELTNGTGVDAALVTATSKSSKPVNLGLELLRDRGKLVIVGDVPIKVDRELMYRKEATLIVSRSYGPGRYDEIYEVKGIDYPIGYVRWTLKRNMQAFLEFVKDRKIDLKPLISKIITIDEAPRFYEDLVGGKGKYIGVVISYDASKYLKGVLNHKLYINKPEPVRVSVGKNISSKKIRLGIIGAGSFVNNVILPILLGELKDLYEIIAVHAKHPQNCIEMGKKAKAQYCVTDYRDILADEKIDAVIIATRHNTHAEIVTEAINASKAIFVEKPLALSEDELNKVYYAYRKNPVPLTVDFNRRFSPLTLKAKKLLSAKPIYAIYRINAGFLPSTHWTQDPEIGGDRILGEVCHFVDFFNFMVDSKVLELVVQTIPVDNVKVVAKDNVAIVMRWADESLTSIHYFAIGSQKLPKEYIEFHCNNSSVIIDDFIKMDIYSNGIKKTVKLERQDKGHKNHLVEFANLVKGKRSAIPPFEDYTYSMKITFEIEKRLRNIMNI